jgi:hypothetical protein
MMMIVKTETDLDGKPYAFYECEVCHRRSKVKKVIEACEDVHKINFHRDEAAAGVI